MSIPEHTHAEGSCPVTGASPSSEHAFCPAQKGDSRSPCPALNTLANHGYLPRDGKCITPHVLMHGLRKGYHLSASLSWVLVHGGFYLLGQRRKRICLHDLSRHNCIEHNASLVHPNVHYRDEYAPIDVHQHLLEDFMAFAKDGELMTPDDVAAARVCREAERDGKLDRLHAEIARGEMAIVLHLFNNPSLELESVDPSTSSSSSSPSLWSKLKRAISPKSARPQKPLAPLPGVPLDILRVWMHEERLPDGWRPYHKTGLLHVIQMSSRLRDEMAKLAKKEPALLLADRKRVAEKEEEALVEAIAVAESLSPALKIVTPEVEQAEFNITLEQGAVGDLPLSERALRQTPSLDSTAVETPSTSMTRESSEAPLTPTDFMAPTIVELPSPESDSPSGSSFLKDKEVLTIITEVQPTKNVGLAEEEYEENFDSVMEMPRAVAVAC